MTKHMKLTVLGLVSALMITTIAPITVQAGTLTIYNKDCTHGKGFKKKKWVSVHVYDKKNKECTDTYVHVNENNSKTVSLIEETNNDTSCYYKHEAKGTIIGSRDIPGYLNSSVTCKKDWANVCQCTKD